MRVGMIYFNIVVVEKLLHFFTEKSWFFIRPYVFGFIIFEYFSKQALISCIFLDLIG